jgi:hypothetical protein
MVVPLARSEGHGWRPFALLWSPVAPFDRIRKATAKVEKAEQARAAARAELRAAILEARDEGVPLAVIARAAGLSRERVRQLVQPRKQRKKGGR